ncbi:hypothetical protein GCM10012285_41020 [Streptomyces kronopolitis]|uniref:Uncharacterized protein n=1 Tax=Streptomyces kronopolitis TaxID=1612435 RepID=A0ABQ2JNI0_9ACTN|nr:hypothetical protein [Streptomyces kronopolitis]GGN51189.1 hypothetical protein GCM10012285_41020 [Streptomyces kronopolitis]
MALHLLCKDPASPNNGSPTLYYDDETDSYLLQSWKVHDPDRLASVAIPDHETIVEFPARLLMLFPSPESMPQRFASQSETIAP